MKKIMGMFTVCLLLASCSAENDIQVKGNVLAALENEEYDKALTLVEENLAHNSVDEETKKLYENILAFNEVRDAKSNEDWDGVLAKAHALLENPTLENSLKVELDKMILEAEMEINDSIREHFEQNSMISDEEGNLPPASNVKEEETTKPSEESLASLKERYLAKLADVENDVKEFDQLGTQVDITEAQAEVLSRWDNMLNEIYTELKNQLSTSDMQKLSDEQQKWLKNRDEKATEAARKYEGGSMKTLEYISTQARLTKERSYELVDLYMK